jgi:hypothetical protein
MNHVSSTFYQLQTDESNQEFVYKVKSLFEIVKIQIQVTSLDHVNYLQLQI